jgi:hypothetical protein
MAQKTGSVPVELIPEKITGNRHRGSCDADGCHIFGVFFKRQENGYTDSCNTT